MFSFHFDTVVATAVSVMELLEATIIEKNKKIITFYTVWRKSHINASNDIDKCKYVIFQNW